MTDSFTTFSAQIQGIYNATISGMHEDISSGWYMESGDNKNQSVISKLTSRIKTFFDKVIKAISDLFAKKKVQDASKVKLPSNTKIEISEVNQKMINQGKISLKDLEKCKNSEDVNRALNNYRKKKTAIKAVKTTAVITGAAAIAWLLHGKSKQIKEIEAERDKAYKQRDAYAKSLSDTKNKLNKSQAQNADLGNKLGIARATNKRLQNDLSGSKQETKEWKIVGKMNAKENDRIISQLSYENDESYLMVEELNGRFEILNDLISAGGSITNEIAQKVMNLSSKVTHDDVGLSGDKNTGYRLKGRPSYDDYDGE